MKKILFVEDDLMISEIYQRKFEAAGFVVGTAATGKEVLRKAKEMDYDLVLLDMVLPEMTGLEVLEQLKKSDYPSDMKVIIFSNLSEKEDQDKAFAIGADGYIPKTQFSPSDLVVEIERRLNDYGEEKKNKNKKENGGAKVAVHHDKKQILFIEDEDIFIEMFGKKLEEAGYEVQYAKNGAWGVKEAIKGDFDLIIMDMVMPAMGGKEMMERLRLEDKMKNVPIVVLSASATEEDLNEVKKMGVRETFVKTRVVPSELVKEVNKILKK